MRPKKELVYQKKYFTSGIGDTIIGISILLFLAFLVPIIIDPILTQHADFMGFFIFPLLLPIPSVLVYIILISVYQNLGKPTIIKYNQLLIFSIIYTVLYIPAFIFIYIFF